MYYNMRMKNNQNGFAPVIIALIIGAIAAAAVGAYYMSRGSTPSPAATETRETVAVPAVPKASDPLPEGEFTANIDEVVARGETLECDVKNPTGDSATAFTGKMYSNGGMGRSEVKTTISSGMELQSNALYKEGTIYSWTYMNGNLLAANTIAKEDAERKASEMTAEEKQKALEYRNKMVFNCKAWTPDASKFTPPEGVKFEPMKL